MSTSANLVEAETAWETVQGEPPFGRDVVVVVVAAAGDVEDAAVKV